MIAGASAGPGVLFQSAPRSGERGDTMSAPAVNLSYAFQSAPRSGERGDRQPGPTRSGSPCFNPRLAPESEAMRGNYGEREGEEEFQSAPRSGERGDNRGLRHHAVAGCFNPRLAPESEAICGTRVRASLRVFQSAPRSGERGDRKIACAASRSRCFNPRLAPESEAIDAPASQFAAVCCFNPRLAPESEAMPRNLGAEGREHVSIRASLRRARRSTRPPGRPLPNSFQSAPRSGERGDARRTRFPLRSPSFNPRLAPESEAMVSEGAQRLHDQGFNPRLAPESEAMTPKTRSTACAVFQSAPRSGERGDDRSSSSTRTANCFNPRLAPESEAIGHLLTRYPRDDVSIRASLRRARRSASISGSVAPPQFQSAPRSGERGDSSTRGTSAKASSFNPRLAPESEAMLVCKCPVRRHHVSIRASLRRARRLPSTRRAAMPIMFQSAPRSGERGDGVRPPGPVCGTVSIRASLRRARRFTTAPAAPAGLVFQSAPRSGERGDELRTEDGSPITCFNPRLAPESEAMPLRVMTPPDPVVSIRASLRRARRSALRAEEAALQQFQSAPRSGERGDPNLQQIPAAAIMFQSAPRSGERGDPLCGQPSSRLSMFQSAPRSGERGDALGAGGSIGDSVSIRASLRRARRSTVRGPTTPAPTVSIRASLRRARRLSSLVSSTPRRRFQSAPRSGERGDRRARPARYSSSVSIRASLRRARRYHPGERPRRPGCFNPRLAPESEAMAPTAFRTVPRRWNDELRSLSKNQSDPLAVG